MHDALLDALTEAAERNEGIDFEGLIVERDERGIRVETPARSREGLDESDLETAIDGREAYVANWYHWNEALETGAEARRAFLRWLERADDLDVPERYERLRDGGITRTWGELSITAAVDGDGFHRYELRHVDDADAPGDELRERSDPLEARELATYDEKGRYRPLKTAPSLPAGWRFPDLDGDELVTAVEYFYPATIENWHREREGTLDVTHWRETAERQTGIYDIIEELDAEAVERIAESCCVDSQCLKRREWQYDAARELDVDGGDGVFPCREPCSLVIAAARKWTTLEREEPRTYEFELTPGEKEQLEAIVDAVADDRLDEIREADFGEGANRYRARYLRSKLFDDEGRLGGVPTDGD